MAYPEVNGIAFEYASIEIIVGARTITGVKEISYKHSTEPGKLYGTRAKPIARTRGQYSAEGAITLYKEDASELIQALGPGYMGKSFDILTHYSEAGKPVITDRLVGCRIKSEDDSHSEGNDALVTKFDLDVFSLVKNGVEPVIEPNG